MHKTNNMKSAFSTLVLVLILSISSAQTFKQYTVGHPVTISLPEYMIRTIGINEAAMFQYKNEVKEVYGFVIEDNKEEMAMADITFSSIGEVYEDFIKDFIEGEQQVKQGNPISQVKGTTKFLEADVSFYDTTAKAEVYYLIGIVETKTSFYKVISYCELANKAKFKEDFRKIIYSLKD